MSKLARFGKEILPLTISGHRIFYALRQKGIPLSRFVPQTIGGDSFNIWSSLVANEKINRKPLWDFIEHHRCKTILEIGLGDGGNIEKMIELAGDGCEYYCFDNLSQPRSWIPFLVLKNMKNVHFYIGDTRETLPNVIDKLPKMDMIFVDGGHDRWTVKNDWDKICKPLMHDGTAVFFHDYNISEGIGVKKVVDEIGDDFSVEIIKPDIGPLFALVRRKKP